MGGRICGYPRRMGLRGLLDRLTGHREHDLTTEVRAEEALAQARWWVDADRYAAVAYGPDSVERCLLLPTLSSVWVELVSVAEYRVGNELWPHVELMEEPLRVELQRYAGELGLSGAELARLENVDESDDVIEAARPDPAALADLERRWTVLRRELVDRLGTEWVSDGPLPNTPRGEYLHALAQLSAL
jgi:hypothetical protein